MNYVCRKYTLSHPGREASFRPIYIEILRRHGYGARLGMTKNRIYISCAKGRSGITKLKKGKQKAFGKNQRLNGKWQQPILPVGCPTSTFGAAELNFCVRNENRWDLSAIVTTMDI